MDAESEVVSKDVAFIQGVTDSVKDNVYGCTILQVKFFLEFFRNSHFFTPGHKCRKPGHVDHGQWKCEEQDIPIPESVDLNGNLETYPGRFNCIFWPP